MATEVGGEAEDLGGFITVRISPTRRQRPTTLLSTTITVTSKTSLAGSRNKNRTNMEEVKAITRQGVMKMEEDTKITDMVKEEDMKIMDMKMTDMMKEEDMKMLGMTEGGHI